MAIFSGLKNDQVARLVWKWRHRYRVVRYNIPSPNNDICWYILRRRGIWPFVWYEGVCGYDRGAPGEYNYQLERTANPATAVRIIIEIAEHYLTPTRINWWRMRDPLPRLQVEDEVDLPRTLQKILSTGVNLDMEFEDSNRILELAGG
jgi:hypothetical protein